MFQSAKHLAKTKQRPKSQGRDNIHKLLQRKITFDRRQKRQSMNNLEPTVSALTLLNRRGMSTQHKSSPFIMIPTQQPAAMVSPKAAATGQSWAALKNQKILDMLTPVKSPTNHGLTSSRQYQQQSKARLYQSANARKLIPQEVSSPRLPIHA